jgi:uncharacterized membrane protein
MRTNQKEKAMDIVLIAILAGAVLVGVVKFQIESILEENKAKKENKVETESK